MEYLLSLLPYLACPVGMGLMMWFLMRGNQSQAMGSMPMPSSSAPAKGPTADPSPDGRLAQLRARLGEVQAKQATIAAQIARLGAEDRPAVRRGGAGTDSSEPASSPPGRRA